VLVNRTVVVAPAWFMFAVFGRLSDGPDRRTSLCGITSLLTMVSVEPFETMIDCAGL
jgi:hypothetical protein